MSLSTLLSINVNATLTKDIDLCSTSQRVQHQLSRSINMGDGTGANKANLCHADSHQIAASGSKTYDLNALVDGFGDAINMARTKLVGIINKSADASITIGGDFFGTEIADLPIGPGGFLMLGTPDATGRAVTDTSGDEITITNTDGVNAADIEIIVIGADA